MEYHSKFNLGDAVFAVSSSNFNRIVRCKPCGNTGKLQIGGEELICPKCNGRCTHTQYAGQKFYIAQFDAVVGKIQIEHTDAQFTRPYNEDSPLNVAYMLEQTGVGSGQVWREEHLFATKEDAQAFCDRSNGVLPADETADGDPIIGMFGEVIPVAVKP